MASPSRNNGYGASTDDFSRFRSSRSPLAERSGNADPDHDGSPVELDMNRRDPGNEGASEMFEAGERYKPLYEPR